MIVAGIGGHLLAEDGTPVRTALAPLRREPLVVTHGNGPQVGEELLRAPDTPIHAAVARTQGELGSRLALELDAICVVTHVVVDPGAPAFREPTKPVGPFYEDEVEARRLAREGGWKLTRVEGRGWRRVVASPAPLEVVEASIVAELLVSGGPVVACGGGGIPVARRYGGLIGVDAVIDKDRASALLAAVLGARRLVLLTDVDAVYRDFRTSSEHVVERLTPAEAEELLPALPAGSMRPKIEACADFVRASGGEALVTSPDALAEALAGRAGTRIMS